MKQCNKCKENKELHKFSKDKATKDGFKTLCKICCSLNHKIWALTNLEKKKASNKKWALANPEKISANNKKWVLRHPDKAKSNYKFQNKKWALANSGKKNAAAAKHRTKKVQATPPWLTFKQHQEIIDTYLLAKELSWLSNSSLEVDHIIPLQGENVCGLHVPWNLQILPKSMNCSKGNRIN